METKDKIIIYCIITMLFGVGIHLAGIKLSFAIVCIVIAFDFQRRWNNGAS